MSEDSKDNKASGIVEKIAEQGLESVGKHWGESFASVILRLLGKGQNKAMLYLKGGSEGEAQTQAGVKLIDVLNMQAIDKLKDEPQLQQAAMDNLRAGAMRHFDNKRGVIEETAKELDRKRPEQDNTESAEPLSEAFLGRFEPYAEKASTEELRAKWGKVLAGEIRKPGTFSSRVMRIVDEVDKDTAELFQKLCQWRIGDIIPLCLLADELKPSEQEALETEGLLFPTESGLNRPFSRLEGKNIWCVALGESWLSVADNKSFTYPSAGQSASVPIIKVKNESPRIPVFKLTQAGHNISSIFCDRQNDAFQRYFEVLSHYLPGLAVYKYTPTIEETRDKNKFMQVNKNRPDRIVSIEVVNESAD